MDAQVGNATEQPLIVTCQTCQVRLRVRSHDALGTIVPCPKCKSLVHVVAPTEVDSAEISDAQQPHTVSASQPPSDSPSPSHDGQAPPRATPRATLTMAVTAAVIVIGGVTLLARWWYVSNMAQAANIANGQQRQGDDVPSTQTGAGTNNGNNADASTASKNEDASSPSVQNGPGDTSEPELPPLPEHDAVADVENADDTRSMPADVPSAGLGGDGCEFSAVAGNVGAGNVGTPSPDVPIETEPTNVDATANAQPSPARPSLYLRRNGKSDSPKDAARIERALQFPIVGIEFSDKPLIDVLRTLGDVARAPICLPPAALEAAEIDAHHTVSLQLTDATLGECLNQILDPLKLTIDFSASCIVVQHREQRSTAASAKQNAGTNWEPSQPGNALQASLAKRFTFSFTTPTPLVDVLRHWESHSGITMLVDWHWMASHDLYPHTLVTAAAIEQPLQRILDELLPVLDLQFHAVDDRTIWITPAFAKQKTPASVKQKITAADTQRASP